MANYQKGVKLEREVVQIFKNAGFQATRTAGSHSPFDVILWKETEFNKKVCFVAFVQCKTAKIRNKKLKEQSEEDTEDSLEKSKIQEP